MDSAPVAETDVKTIPPPLHAVVEPPESELRRSFFNLTGGSVLYCLSALFVTLGISQLLVPLLVEPESLRATYPCLAVLNLYELALLGTLLYIVVREKVTDDAISLLILVALFLVGSGVALTCVSLIGPRPAQIIGGCCLLLALAKLAALCTPLGMALRGWGMASLALLLAWNFLSGPLLALHHVAEIVVKGDWMVSWLLLLAGGVGGCAAAGGAESDPAPRPFLHRKQMVYLFALVLWVALVVHQHVQGMVFCIERSVGDYLPALGVAVLLGLCFLRALRPKMGMAEYVVALLPLVATLMAVMAGAVAPVGGWRGLLWRPSIFLLAMGGGLLAVLWRDRSRRMAVLPAAYALGVLLTWGARPGASLLPNLKLMGALLLAALLLYGYLRRMPRLCLAMVTAGVLVLMVSGRLGELARSCHTVTIAFALILWSLGIALMVARLGDECPRPLFVLGALAGTIGSFVLIATGLQVANANDLLLLGLAGVGLLTYGLRVRFLPAVLLAILPLAVRGWMLTTRLAAWRFVILSFVLLYVGARLSVRKARRRAGEE